MSKETQGTLAQQAPAKGLGITPYAKEAQGPALTPLEPRRVEALEKIGAELELMNRFLVVLPELIVIHGIISYRGNQAPGDVVRQAANFTAEFFKLVGETGADGSNS